MMSDYQQISKAVDTDVQPRNMSCLNFHCQ